MGEKESSCKLVTYLVCSYKECAEGSEAIALDFECTQAMRLKFEENIGTPEIRLKRTNVDNPENVK
jgi:hypothetical protein